MSLPNDLAPSTLAEETEAAPVAIIGAGPVGMTCALRLADFGVASVVLEANNDLLARGSKACLIQGDALEILDKCGCAEPIGREGVTWRVGHTYVRGREIRRTEYPARIGFGAFVNISQYRVEQILRASLDQNPRARIDWSNRVVALTQDAEGATLRVDTPAGVRERRFRYVIACDGVRSTARDLVGVKWKGYTHKDPFLITDIKADLPFAAERHFHYDPPFNPGRQLVIHPQPDSVWRIDWQLAPSVDIEAERRSGLLDRRIRAVIGEVPYEIKWLSTYRFHQRVVERFRIGRVFLAGDAAHAFPPYGSRGMNSGIQDADNIAWKLGMVLAGKAQDDLLDTYHDERSAAAKENLRITEATIRFMVPPNPLVRAYRSVVLRLSRFSRRMRGRVNSGRMTEPFKYDASRIIDRSGDGLVGAFAPDMLVDQDGARGRLREFFGHSFVFLHIVRSGVPSPAFLERARAVAMLPYARVVVAASEKPRTPASDGNITFVRYRWADLTQAFPDSLSDLYLVRPDGHVAGACRACSVSTMEALLQRALGRRADGTAQILTAPPKVAWPREDAAWRSV